MTPVQIMSIKAMNWIVILIRIRRGLGSIVRYLTASFLPKSFSYGTFMVNVVGWLRIGIFYGLSERYNRFASDCLLAGFCGGFTIVSSSAYENSSLLQTSEYFTFAQCRTRSFTIDFWTVFGGLTLNKNTNE